MTIDELRRQIEQRLMEAREEVDRSKPLLTRSDMGPPTRRRSTSQSLAVDRDLKRVGDGGELLAARPAKLFWRPSPAATR